MHWTHTSDHRNFDFLWISSMHNITYIPYIFHSKNFFLILFFSFSKLHCTVALSCHLDYKSGFTVVFVIWLGLCIALDGITFREQLTVIILYLLPIWQLHSCTIQYYVSVSIRIALRFIHRIHYCVFPIYLAIIYRYCEYRYLY